MKPPKIIDTTRLQLSPPLLEDAPSIFITYAQNPSVTKFLTWLPHQSIEETETFLHGCVAAWANDSAYPWVIRRKEDDQVIGMVEIRIAGHKAELGYVLAKPEWGKGYMPEAVKPIIEWAMSQGEIYRVWAVCDVENKASARVLEKVGMAEEGVLRRWIIHPNLSKEPRDCLCFAVIK